MKKPWYAWIGQFLLLAMAVLAALGKVFGLAIPWAVIIVPAATWLADLLLALVPDDGWAKAIGKLLLWAVATVELALSQMGVSLPIWPILGAFIVAIANYLIGLIPKPTS
jgi:hypothetical protein